MKPPRDLVIELEQDLLRGARSGKVLYLEGRTDVPLFLALVGRHAETVSPQGCEHDGVWIRGLGGRRGSGGSAVRSRVHAARELGYGTIRGLIDGDGEAYETLAARFSDPPVGEPHRWPTYCIENWLPQVGWPPSWGVEPSWGETLGAYVPYAALNCIVASTQRQLSLLGLQKYRHPTQGTLDTVEGVREKLSRVDPSSRDTYDVVGAFDAEVERCRAVIARSVQHGHALINGKWLVNHHVPSVCGGSPEDCRRGWSEHVAALGGHRDVRAWWERFVAS